MLDQSKYKVAPGKGKSGGSRLSDKHRRDDEAVCDAWKMHKTVKWPSDLKVQQLRLKYDRARDGSTAEVIGVDACLMRTSPPPYHCHEAASR